jgi:hypothetical protein
MEVFYNFIAYPEEAIYNISRKEPGYTGFLFLLLANISLVTGRSLLWGASTASFLFSLTWGLVVSMIVCLFMIFFLSLLYHYFSEIFGGAGQGSRLFKALPFSFCPFIFFTPSALIIRSFAGKTGWFFIFLIFFIMLLWTVFLQFKIINYFYGLSAKNTVMAFTFSWCVVIGFATAVPVAMCTYIFKLLL